MKDLSFKTFLPALIAVGNKLRTYLVFSVFLLLAVVYGFTIVQISRYSNPTVGDDEVLSKLKASSSPRIDENAAAKLESLEDNSVNVQTLFKEGRENPFGE